MHSNYPCSLHVTRFSVSSAHNDSLWKWSGRENSELCSKNQLKLVLANSIGSDAAASSGICEN